MTLDVSRRQFMKLAGAGAGTAIGSLGFGPAEAMVAAHVRSFKLARATETRNTCPYCSVACGIIMYSLGDRRKTARGPRSSTSKAIPIIPMNRGTLCPKGAALLDFVHAQDPAAVSADTAHPVQRHGRAHVLGRGAGPHRAADEGRPRHRTSSPRTRTASTVNRWLDDRHAGGVGDHQRDGAI